VPTETPPKNAKPGATPSPGAQVGIFSRRGDYWTVGLGDIRFPIKDIKGLGYIQRLLLHPNKEFHALDLLSTAGGGAPAPDTVIGAEEALPVGIAIRRGLSGDSGEMLDEQAKREYGRRLDDLKELLEDQRERGNYERVDQIEREIEDLSHEIGRAVGLSGRDRRSGSNAERARLSVRGAIKAAIQQVSAQDKSLGLLLQRCVKTGTFCSYSPGDASVDWQFSAGDSATISPEKGPERSLGDATIQAEFFEKTPFVGRGTELGLLSSCLDEVQAGRGRLVLVGGAAGVGKTRLAVEIARQAIARGMPVLAGHCNDREDPLAYGPFVEIIETALSRASTQEAFRELLGRNAPDVARAVPQLRRVMPDLLPSGELPSNQSRHLMFRGIAEFVSRYASQRPFFVLLEDIHWADEASLMLLTFLAQRIVTTPVLILATYRDFEVKPDRPLAKALEDLIRSHAVLQIKLEGLSEQAVAEMLRGLSGYELSDRVLGLFYSETEGNPFFVEELFQHLVEQGQLTSSAQSQQTLEITDTTVPNSVRLIIGRRLARLREVTRKVLRVAAIIGRSFSFELLESSSQAVEAETLLTALEEAEDFGLIQSTPGHQDAKYRFSHELNRQAVIRELSPARCQRLHLQVADAIEDLYQGQLEDHTSDLAHHLWQAGSSAPPARTVHFLAMAAKQEIAQNAFESALRHLRNARELLKKLPDSPERGLRELDIQIDYGNALVVSKGNYAPEVGEAYKRARDLSHKFADRELQRFSVAFGLWMFHISRGEHIIARSFAEEMLEMAERAEDDGLLAGAYSVLGNSQFFMGQFAAAHSSYEQGFARYDQDKHRKLARVFGQDAGLSCLCYDAMALWILGFPDNAAKKAEDALAFARHVKEPYDLAWCSGQLAMYFQLRLDLQRAEAVVDEGLALAEKYQFSQPQTALKLYRFIGLTLQGKTNREIVTGLGGKGKAPYELAGTWGAPRSPEL